MSSASVRRSSFSPAEIARISKGTLLIRGGDGVSSVVIDSRQVRKGALFIPLAGTKVNGHTFLAEALKKGAHALLASRVEWEKQKESLAPLVRERKASLIVVEDTLVALQKMAKNRMRALGDVLRIGITGSNGKTTTKEIIGTILAAQAQTAISEGNLNSEIGLPLSVFQVQEDDRYAVFELGMNHVGEMDIITDIFRPDLALITNIGKAHIGLLGSEEAIAREKKKIFRYLEDSGKAFLYEGERFFKYLTAGIRGKVIPYGPQSTKGYEGSLSLGLVGTAIHWEGLQIHFPLFGVHNLLNALASLSVSVELGISKRKIKAGLEQVKPLFGRSQIIKGQVSVIQDCYNSNPDSVRMLFDFLKPLAWQGRKIMVLGSMLELGMSSEEAHREIGQAAGRSGFDMIFLFGPEMETAYTALKLTGFCGYLDWTEDMSQLRCRLIKLVRPGDLVLLKGSRGVALERLLPDLAPASSQALKG